MDEKYRSSYLLGNFKVVIPTANVMFLYRKPL